MVHPGTEGGELGVLMLVAGGPQYRGGCGRQLVLLARGLAEAGIHVFRFDHRGLGDSAGPFRGFEHMGADLEAAVRAFRKAVPSVKRIALWGGCDAASAAMIHAARIPEVTAILAANPWVTSADTAMRVRRKHYLNRLLQPSFWRKLLAGKYRLADYLPGRSQQSDADSGADSPEPRAVQAEPATDAFVNRMLEGLEAYRGDLYLLKSGRSLVSREFDELVASNRRWRRAVKSRLRASVTVPDADQTFSSRATREAMIGTVQDWCRQLQEPQ